MIENAGSDLPARPKNVGRGYFHIRDSLQSLNFRPFVLHIGRCFALLDILGSWFSWAPGADFG